MTYFEKLRSVIKINRELVNEPCIRRLESRIYDWITCDCPGNYFPGAPMPDDEGRCSLENACEKCWNQEVEPNAGR